MRIILLSFLLVFCACPKPQEPVAANDAKPAVTESIKATTPEPALASTKSEALTPSPEVTPAAATPSVTPTKPPATPTATPTPAEKYRACGCGCCGGTESPEKCIYHAKGDSLEKIKADDQKSRDNPRCAVAGCSLGTTYKYCD